jgi:uncharacterized membrane protein
MSFFQQLGKGKIAGHPIHVMLVHFPIALFPVSLLFDILHYKLNNPSFSEMGYYSMMLGVVGGYAAAIFGIIDLTHLGKDPVIINKALIHAGINGSVVFTYTVLVALRYKHPDHFVSWPFWFIIINGFLNVLLVIGAYYGGDLILRHKVGMKE